MAGFYETMLQNLNSTPVESYVPSKTATVFGDAATTPSSIDASNARIEYLKQMVTNAEQALAAEQSAYNSAVKNYNNQLRSSNSGNSKPPIYTLLKALGTGDFSDYQKKGQITAVPTAPSQTALTNARKALTSAQNDVAEAQANQKLQILAGQDAVAQGLAAKTAEQQGIANAAQLYQNAMQGEAIRNAIMNGAIGTVGTFGGAR